jgi:hypothetical protein
MAAGLLLRFQRVKVMDWITMTPQKRLAHRIERELRPQDRAHWGGGASAKTVSGHTRVGTTNTGPFRVALLETRTFQLVSTTWSGADGAFSFAGLNPDFDYLAIAEDRSLNYNAVVADGISPV